VKLSSEAHLFCDQGSVKIDPGCENQPARYHRNSDLAFASEKLNGNQCGFGKMRSST